MVDLVGKKIMVVGLGRTGVSLTKFLAEKGAKVTVSDHKSPAELANYLDDIDHLELSYDLGGHTPRTFIEQEMIILSPGISPELKIFEYARNHGVRVTGEFEFASHFVEEPVLAVTGTNGKSTACRLMERMLNLSGIKTWLGGNFGAPLIEYVMQPEKAQLLVAEVSSFQLEHCENFTPHNIVFMNLAENHLDRHRTFDAYVNAKRKVFRNTNHKTTSVLNADDKRVVDLARDPIVQRGRILYFSRKAVLEPQIMNIGGAVNVRNEVRLRVGPEIEIFRTDKMRMVGRHQIENVMSAILATRELGAKPEVIQQVIDEFPGLEHRIEYVRKAGGVKFYNDSKSTNVHSVIRALDSFDENVILIMGGKDTGLNYEPLIPFIRQKVKTLILVGEAKERINRAIGDFAETFLIGTFEEAILISYQKSRINDTVLMSPGCPSFDIFDSYVERGNYYKSLVAKFS
ncbi:MAG: UDP-N-acetylmuramoyl-L-alanine--D-glutamate ligase [Bdellovibrionales bacterium]